MSCTLLGKQFILLLWKNFILQIRRPIGTTFELTLPAFAITLLVVLRLSNVIPPQDVCFSTYEPDNLMVQNPTDGLPYTIYFTPENNKTNEIISKVLRRLAVPTEAVGFIDETSMVENLTANFTGQQRRCFSQGAGIVFDSLDGSNIEYTLRLRTPRESWGTDGRGNTIQSGSRTSNLYLEEGFLHLQNAVSMSIIEFMANLTINLSVSVQQFPYPPFARDAFYLALGSNIPLLIVLAFMLPAGYFVKELVLEKETRIRETMLMMGLRNWILWSSWYLKQFIYLMISTLVVCILLKAGRILPQTNFLLLLIYFIVYILSVISFCFFISVWFNSARLGLAMGFTFFFLSFCPFYLVQPIGFENLGFGGKMGMCVLSNACMALGVEVISRLEQRFEGLQWSNVATPLTEEDPFNVGWVFFMLILETIVYMVLAWYINGVKPGQYGVRLPFYFPCQPSYWIGRRNKVEEHTSPTSDESIDPSNHEEVTGNLEVGISIKNLTKIFGLSFLSKRIFKSNKPPKKAVDNVSLNIYKGQITALLGHNGAGKTTTMSMLTGLYSPTSGTATVNGLSIVTDIGQIRRSLGICPQHNILFDRLTLFEHLAFFLRLKGVFNRKRVRDEVTAMVEDIQLVGKRNTQAGKLSGGMKRKLSVAIALIGGSEVIILDEPTSGMDPYARRSTWDLLVKHKPGRTMLLTTHFMDEADILGDRIAIMAEGKIRCSGSSLFLKSKYGVGYHMTIVKDESCDPEFVDSTIKSIVPKAEQATNVGAELSYVLPSSSTPSFSSLFDKLEADKTRLGISSFGISVTTMEEVFIKVGEGVDDERLRQRGLQYHTGNNGADVVTVANLEAENDVINTEQVESEAHTVSSNKRERLTYTFTPNSGLYLWTQQIRAMLVKKFFISIRSYGFLISQILFPVLFVILGNVIAIAGPDPRGQDPQRVLTLDNSALFTNNLTLFYAQLGDTNIGSSSLRLSDLMSSRAGARNVLNYTGQVLQLKENIEISSQNVTIRDCCNYQFQLLDQYCASRPFQSIEQVCDQNNDFGYNACSECLSCCESTTNGLRSCSNILSSTFSTTDMICPSPPKLSLSSFQDSDPRGLLDSDNVYVSEQLLKIFNGIRGRPDFFFRSFQAGFSVNQREPTNTVCGCNATQNITDFLLISSNGVCNDTDLNNCVCGSTTREGSMSTACSEAGQTVGRVYSDEEPEIEATVWYNNQPLHMSAAALSIFHNLVLRSETGDDGLSIVVNNHPLPRNASEQINDAATDPATFAIGFTVGFFVVFAFSSMVASFVVNPVEEKEKKVKHLQFLSGLHSSSYWLATYIWDLLNTLVPIVLTIIVFAIFRVDAFSSPQALGAIFIVLFLTGWAAIPVSYMASFLFSNALIANSIVNLALIFTALLAQILVFVFRFFVTNGETIADVLHHIFLISPTYGLTAAIGDLAFNENIRSACDQLGLSRDACLRVDPSLNFVNNPLSVDRPGIGVILIYMVFEGIIYFLLTLLIQKNLLIPQLKAAFMKEEVNDMSSTPLLKGQDSDVSAEANKVLSGATSDDDIIVMKNLVKVYAARLAGCTRKPSKRAVNGINLAIPSGECFGLLGVNGAGKTTTFSILTGALSMTSGKAVVAGYDVVTQLRDVQKRIGYCPQFDALIGVMTGRELLTMYARLRGVPENQIKDVVEIELTRLDLKKHANKRCEKYSGGNKRKLCTAIALIGNPPIILLDEPTTGMDPTTKRYLWDVLTGITEEGRSIVLTSHSMEECEALCNRLAIMVNGSFRCLGSVQHLKNKFSSGLTLQAKVSLAPQSEQPVLGRTPSKRQQSHRRSRLGSRGFYPVSEEPTSESHQTSNEEAIQLGGRVESPGSDPYDATSLNIFIQEAFPGSVLLEQHQGFVSYQLPSDGLKWSSVFREIESNKERLGIVDYSVSQTTLDQVFINFAKEQKDDSE